METTRAEPDTEAQIKREIMELEAELEIAEIEGGKHTLDVLRQVHNYRLRKIIIGVRSTNKHEEWHKIKRTVHSLIATTVRKEWKLFTETQEELARDNARKNKKIQELEEKLKQLQENTDNRRLDSFAAEIKEWVTCKLNEQNKRSSIPIPRCYTCGKPGHLSRICYHRKNSTENNSSNNNALTHSPSNNKATESVAQPKKKENIA